MFKSGGRYIVFSFFVVFLSVFAAAGTPWVKAKRLNIDLTPKGFDALSIFGLKPAALERMYSRSADAGDPTAEDPDKRSNWFMEQRLYPFRTIPANARADAFEKMLDTPSLNSRISTDAVWRSIGPRPTAGKGPGGNTSGRINEIAVSPANPQIVLVAGSTGGIWRSTDGGTSFSPVSDSHSELAVGSIAFAPSDPNIVYAGLGDNDNGYWGSGVLKSSDAGATWTRPSNVSFLNSVKVTRVRVDPTNPNKVYLALNTFRNTATNEVGLGGVVISTDGGSNWTPTLNGLATDLAIHPTNPQIVYAALTFGAGAAVPRGLFKSVNGGTTWTNVYLSPFTADQRSTRDFRVAVTPADPDRVYIYFGTDGPPKQLQIQTSRDAGQTWSNRGAVPDTLLDPGQFGYNTYLEASPVDADIVYIGCRDIFRYNDSTQVLTNLNNSFAPPYDPGDFTEQLQKIHTDQQAFAFLPGSSTTFFAGNDGGIFKTTDAGATFTSLNNTLSLVQFIGLALHPTDATRSYGGTQDNGSQRRDAGGENWVEYVGGDGGRSVINPLNPAMVFPSFTNGNIARILNNGVGGGDKGIATAESFGETGGDDARVGFYPPIVGNGVDARLYSGSWRLFICSDCDDVTKSLEGGPSTTWTAPGGMFDQTKGGNDVLSTITVAPGNPNIIYTGSTQGRAMVSTNGGANWTDITAGLPDRSIREIAVNPTNPAIVYLTVSGYGSGHVFKSTNSGGTWSDISNNLPNIPTSAFMIDRLTPTTLYAGTDIGVFRSTDEGASWTAFNDGLPPVPVMQFTSQANGLIQIGTYGRGAYELSNAPTGENVTLSSRVLAPGGAGVRGASVTLVDAGGGTRRITTSSLGYFSFGSVATGQTVQISVSSKRYRYTTRSVSVTTSAQLADFVGIP